MRRAPETSRNSAGYASWRLRAALPLSYKVLACPWRVLERPVNLASEIKLERKIINVVLEGSKVHAATLLEFTSGNYLLLV